jgi:mono/diheme cytochrome c family protein
MRRRFKIHWLSPGIFAGAVLIVSLTLLTVGARSPYTHFNLATSYAAGYSRTDQTVIGPPQPYTAQTKVNPNADPASQGAVLFFQLNCASCHGLKGQGGIFAPAIAGIDAQTLASKTSKGSNQMPAFSLTDDQVKALVAYLKSVLGQ